MSPGEIAETATTIAIAGVGQRRMSHAARIATAIHIIWKYLFMSKSTALSDDDVRDEEQDDQPGDEEPAVREVRWR